MQRDRQGDWQLKLNGEESATGRRYCHFVTCAVDHTGQFSSFFGGPKERRQFFDLGLFHVEPSFFEHWVFFHKVLKQRNALLKSKQPYSDYYHYWDQQLATSALVIQQLRQKYIQQLTLALQPLVADDRSAATA